ncbi:MAG: hypothetical protein GXP15_16860 [Gammaproteobacteria bacterium]|nr:hypothetical protein [Gammaproteobacteria bacterium]
MVVTEDSKILNILGLPLTASVLLCAGVAAADKLVLDLELDRSPISMSHNVDGFLFAPTRNYADGIPEVVNDMTVHDALKNHLVVTAFVKMGGNVVGIATEQEYFLIDPATEKLVANSMWLIRLNAPGLSGFLVVNQIESGEEIFSIVQRVMENPDGPWEDETKMYLSTSGKTRVQQAWGDLAPYQDGLFEEYNGLNPSDFKNFNRFRPKIRFVIYPADGQ